MSPTTKEKLAPEEQQGEEITIVGHPLSAVYNKKPPTFSARLWSPFSYILYLWYSPILTLVSSSTRCPHKLALHAAMCHICVVSNLFYDPRIMW